MSLEETIAILESKSRAGTTQLLPDDGEISYYGSADDLEIALGSMARSFTLAIIVLYLLMSALFRSFVDSLLVIAALPLAMVGGVAFLRIMGSPMDLLTMIGFITLLGLVVNNAILLVHQTRVAEREGWIDAVRSNKRSEKAATDLDEHHDQHVWHAALVVDSGTWVRGLRGSGRRYCWWHGGEYHIYLDFPSKPVAYGRN